MSEDEKNANPGPCKGKAFFDRADQVAETGETLVITKNDRPVAELRPAKKRVDSLFGLHKGQIHIKGDIISPIDVEWEAER